MHILRCEVTFVFILACLLASSSGMPAERKRLEVYDPNPDNDPKNQMLAAGGKTTSKI